MYKYKYIKKLIVPILKIMKKRKEQHDLNFL